MKKWISLLLIVVCLMPLGSALGEATGERTTLVLGDTLTVEDLMDFTVKSMSFSKETEYMNERQKFSNYFSGEDYKWLQVDCTLLNTSLNYYSYDKYITNIKIVFMDKFEYEPILLQNMPDKRRPINKLWEIQSLVLTTPIFLFKVPNILQTSLEPIYLYMTIDDVDYVCQLR